MKLDGTDKITPTPFDAHERVVRGHHKVEGHVYSDAADLDHPRRGHLPAEYEHQEYPKAVAHDENGAPVLVHNAHEEAAYQPAAAAEEGEAE